MKIIRFDEVRPRILEEIEKSNKYIDIGERYTLFEAFISPRFYADIFDEVVLGGPDIPMILLIGNDTGRIYPFAVKALLKDIEI